jgi:acetyl esterase/lipase
VWLPPGDVVALVLFLHGGFWQAAFDRRHTATLAAALAREGFVACTPEYGRIGQPAGGWPGTFDDVALAFDTLPGLVVEVAGRSAAVRVDPGRVVLAGHSAGGHLAMWGAGRHRLPVGSAWHLRAPSCLGAVALAPISDLAECQALGLEDDAAGRLVGGPPGRYPDRYALTDPARLIPLGRPVHLVHGTLDDRVPFSMSREYVARARAVGDEVVFTELPGCGHFELIDPLSSAWPAVLDAFGAVALPGA